MKKRYLIFILLLVGCSKQIKCSNEEVNVIIKEKKNSIKSIEVEKVFKNACLRLSSIDNVIGDVECLGVQSLNDSSITFRIIAHTKPTEQYGVERILKKELKKVLDKNNIEIPYPQVVIHNAK